MKRASRLFHAGFISRRIDWESAITNPLIRKGIPCPKARALPQPPIAAISSARGPPPPSYCRRSCPALARAPRPRPRTRPPAHRILLPRPRTRPSLAGLRPTPWMPCTRRASRPFPRRPTARATSCSQPRIEKGVKVFELTARKIQWEIEPGRTSEGWAYNDQVPGRRSGCVRATASGSISQQAAGVDRDPFSRPGGSQRSGRRAVHHPASDQAGRVVHLRVHRAERRLAHVPLAPQRGASRSAWGCSARSSSSRSGQSPSSAPTWTT